MKLPLFFKHFINEGTVLPPIHVINNLIALNRKNKINIEAPLIDKTKREIILMGAELDVDYSNTWTCYEGQELACGQCGSCNERLEAFALNNSIDPLLYKN